VKCLAGLGVVVVANPSFLLHREQKYREQLSSVELQWLVRIGSLLEAGVDVRAGSDSPVVPSRPEEMIASAVHRLLAPSEAVDEHAARQLLAPLPIRDGPVAPA
jgi:predicted amidohydrolase YtcJ